MEQRWFERAVDGFAARLEGVAASGWHRPTPCREWDVHALVNHVVNELRWIPPLLAGSTIAEVGDRFDGDLLGDDPVARHRDAAEAARTAAAAPGARERIVHLSFGDVPGGDYLDQVTTDITIHTWDLARATGGDDRLDEDLVVAVHDVLAPQAEAWRGAGAFGPAVPTAPGADPQTRLLALTGRSVAAEPPAGPA